MKKITLFALFLFSILEIKSQTGPCFSSPVLNFPVSGNPSRGIAAGDLNNDGIPDIATANMNGNNVTWALMSANGSVSTASTLPFGSGSPRAVTIADFNGDSFGDIAAASGTGINLAMSNGTGGFILSTMNVGNPYGIASGDLNGDGKMDIVTANNASNDFAVRLGNGDGTFGTNTNYTAGGGPYFVALAYMNDDDTLDVLTANTGNDNISVSIGVGDGTFNSSMQFSAGGIAQDPYSLCVGDFNNDGNNDVAAAYYQSNNIAVFNGSSAGSLVMSAIYTLGGQPFGITCGHYDADNNMDLAVGTYNGQDITIYTGDGTNSFTQHSIYTVNNSLGLAVTADFNQDGFSDIALADYGFSGSGMGGAYVLLNHRAKITASATSFCEGDSTLLVANNGSGFNYSWSTNASVNDSIMVNATANVTLTITNGSATCSTSVAQAIVENPLPIVSGTASPASVCTGQQTVLNGSGAQTYTWSGGVTNGVPFVPGGPGTYTVTGTDTNGCVNTATTSITSVAAPLQEVCTLTTDSATGNHNMVIWEKPADIGRVDSFFIYREITLNNYQKIGAVHADSLSEYHDYAANPNVTGYRYKMAILDTCGNLGTLGLWHNSIHLQYFGGGNFSWNKYEIETGNFPALSYNFYRDNNADGNWTLLQTVSGSQTSFSDVAYASFPIARYRVEVGWNITCTSTQRIGNGDIKPLGAINTSRSNIRSPATTIIGLKDESSAIQLNVYPNPFVNEVSFEISNTTGFSGIEIYNNLGQKVFADSFKGTKFVLSTEEFKDGLYSYKLTNELISKTGTLIKINK